MSEPRPRYEMTLRDLRQACPLLAKIEVLGHGPSVAGCQHVPGTEQLVGYNAAGEIVVRAKGKVTPALVKKFRDSYQTAVAVGIIKRPIPTEQEPHTK